jgi:hypothetical protein
LLFLIPHLFLFSVFVSDLLLSSTCCFLSFFSGANSLGDGIFSPHCFFLPIFALLSLCFCLCKVSLSHAWCSLIVCSYVLHRFLGSLRIHRCVAVRL